MLFKNGQAGGERRGEMKRKLVLVSCKVKDLPSRLREVEKKAGRKTA